MKNFSIFFIFFMFFIFIIPLSAKAESQYLAPEGAKYYESSDFSGSGRTGAIGNKYSPCVQGECPVEITGWSILDSNGRIVKFAHPSSTIPVLEPGQTLMVCGRSKMSDLGWIPFEQLSCSNESNESSTSIISTINVDDSAEWFESHSAEKTPEATAELLQENLNSDYEVGIESILLGDCSGSMCSFQEDVFRLLEGGIGKKFIFAEEYEEYNSSYSRDIGGATDISRVLNAQAFGTRHVYLISDLGDNCGTPLLKNEEFTGEISIIYLLGGVGYWSSCQYLKEITDAYPNARLSGI